MSKEKRIKFRAPYDVPPIQTFTAMSENEIRAIENMLKKQSANLKKQGVSQEQAQNYLDSIVETYIDSRLNSLFNACQNSRVRILETFTRRLTDKAEIQREIDLLDTLIAMTEAEYNFIENMYKNNNPLYNGKLVMDAYSSENNDTSEGKKDDKK